MSLLSPSDYRKTSEHTSWKTVMKGTLTPWNCNSSDSVVSRNAETSADNVCPRMPSGKRRDAFAWTLEFGLIPLSSDRYGSLINTSAITRKQRWHAAYVSSVQNGAERERAAQASDVWALSHGAERAPRKAPDFQDRNLIPFLLLFLQPQDSAKLQCDGTPSRCKPGARRAPRRDAQNLAHSRTHTRHAHVFLPLFILFQSITMFFPPPCGSSGIVGAHSVSFTHL